MKQYLKIVLSIFLFSVFSSNSIIAEPSDSLEVNVVNTDKKVGNLRFIVRDSSNLILRVMDEEGAPFKTLNRDQVIISREGKNAKILKVSPLKSTIETNLNVVLALDNSSSMQPYRDELIKSVELLLNALRGKSRISAAVFSEDSGDNFKSKIGEKIVNIRKMDFTENHNKIMSFIKRSYNSNQLSQRTYLYDGILVGLQQFEKLPKNLLRVMIVFSDGKDLGSKFKQEQVFAAAANAGITVYGIDFNRDPRANEVMEKLPPSTPQGKTFRAAKATELMPVFDELSKEIITEFQVIYHFPIHPSGNIQFAGDSLIITTRRLIDEFPMLNYVFFDSSSAEISKQYHTFSSPEQAASFDENQIQKPLDKYYHILNIIGSRAQKDTTATLTLTGCNMNLGIEKGNTDLSKQRAEAVRQYLVDTWGIDADRIKILTRNLPKKKSSTRTVAGCTENRRVEFFSDHYNIIKPIRSEVSEYIYEPEIGYFDTKISAPEGLKNYDFLAYSNNLQLRKMSFEKPKKKIAWNWINEDGEKIHDLASLDYNIKITDNDGRIFENVRRTVSISQIQLVTSQTESKQDSIFEKFSLVLFDFNSSKLSANNQNLMQRVLDIYTKHPDASIKVFGYCDDIGDEKYNLKLSKQRAKIAYNILRRMGIPNGQLSYHGYGEINPIFTNGTPEGRFLNRTVQIYIGYPKEVIEEEK